MRLIDADVLFTDEQFEKYMEKILIEDGTGDVYIRPEDVADMIMDAPTIDAEPVKHGKWTVDEKHTEEIYTNPVYCSVCGKDVVMDYGEYAPYCPNCGAKMDKGGDTE